MKKMWLRLFVTIGLAAVFLALCSNPLLKVWASLGGSLWSEAEYLPQDGYTEEHSVTPGEDSALQPPLSSEDPLVDPPTDPITDEAGGGTANKEPLPDAGGVIMPSDQPTIQPTDGRPVVYLTFDDGPSPHVTPLVLEVLKKYQVKATFFVIGSEVERFPDLARQILADGHVIGNHTYSHRYDIIYQSPQHYLEDLRQGQETLRRLLEYETCLTRAPGGSINFTPEYTQLLDENGFIYVDWNVDSGDSRSLTVPAATIIQNTLAGLESKEQAVVLMHDMAMKTTAAEALDQIISALIDRGVVFRTLDETAPTFHFR